MPYRAIRSPNSSWCPIVGAKACSLLSRSQARCVPTPASGFLSRRRHATCSRWTESVTIGLRIFLYFHRHLTTTVDVPISRMCPSKGSENLCAASRMRKPLFGEVIGERRLVERDNGRKSVIVTLGKPRKVSGQNDWECPFRVKGAGINRVEYGYGVDALQALTTALEGIRVILDEIETPLAWSGVLPDHTGFQRMIPIAIGAQMAARLERLVNR